MADRNAFKAVVAGMAAIGSLAVAGMAQAQAVVVRSTGPSAVQYPQGKKLAANASVSLRAGDRLTVLDKSGTRVLSGPGSFTLNGVVSHDVGATTLASMMPHAGGARTRTGAVRGAPMMAAAASSGPDSLWYIDSSKGGTYCVADPSALVLWRPNREDESIGKLTTAEGASVDLAWKRGNALKLWPAAALPVVDGKSYMFTNTAGTKVRITTRLIGAMPADDMGVASMLADKGCNAQLDVLANSATPPAGGQ
ncbi:hypothetical protein [Novosphingobium lentum]|uniref:hypothetical protein n=1 Tax=Novosphingobium lentum TaxID=145287 RepID=UPI0012EED242|nr:hypothetical protein [Novosphingobium lentum]